jgi:glyoxylase-like metal-dependent hydrolase (beta-lactamase superfamily II)
MKPRWLLAPNPSPMTLDGTRTFIVGERRPVVIDPGPAIEAHVDAIVRELGGVTPGAIVVTHSHPDHAGAADALSRATGAPIWLGGRDRIETDAGAIEFVSTPGHTPDHVVIHWAAGNAVFVGDLLMGVGDTTLVAPPEGDLRHYLASLDVLGAMSARTFYPAHGPPITEVSVALERYRRHRMERIEQVRSALAIGLPADPGMLADHVYGADLDPRLGDAARGSIEAILAYLAG